MMQRSDWKRKAMRIGVLVAIPYLIVLVAVFVLQRRLLYAPTTVSPGLALAMAGRAGFEPWLNAGGEIIGWKQVAGTNDQRRRILITHGNAGFALDRVDYARGLNQAAPCDTYLLEFPGYGTRPGSPSQTSLFAAADEGLALLQKDGPVFLIGESLGTGVAAYLAGTHPQAISGLLLVAPYHNLGDVAQHHMPIFPARWMVRDKFPSADYLRNYHGPLAVWLAGRDTVVPNQFGRKLYDTYAGPKRLWEAPSATHNDLPNQPVAWWKEVVAFWAE